MTTVEVLAFRIRQLLAVHEEEPALEPLRQRARQPAELMAYAREGVRRLNLLMKPDVLPGQSVSNLDFSLSWSPDDPENIHIDASGLTPCTLEEQERRLHGQQ